MKTLSTFRFSLLLLLMTTAMYVQAQTTVWHDPLKAGPEMVHGRWWQDELGTNYCRLPESVKDKVTGAVWGNSRHSAGLSIVFRTNSQNITVKYNYIGMQSMNHMPATGVSGVDLYGIDADGRWRWCGCNRRSFGKKEITYKYVNLTYANDHKKGYEFHLFLPLYSQADSLQIGVDEGSIFTFEPTSKERPIVAYGTSICHGGCASRPGMAWTAIIERTLQHPFINLGFSGSGRMEKGMYETLAQIEAKLYLIDCIPNMVGDSMAALVYNRTLDGVKILKQAHPQVPILLVEHEGYTNDATCEKDYKSSRKSNAELKRAFEALKAQGVKDLYYLSMEEIGLTEDACVEGVHPTDVGMKEYADAYIRKIRQILCEDSQDRTKFTACQQNRDPYDWTARHEATIEYNQRVKPEIVMIGNSITHYWAGEPLDPLHRGDKSWAKLFKGKTVVNMGFGWDRIENGLWRIYHDGLYGFEAKKIFMLLGTNNIALNTVEEIVSGQLELLRAVHLRQPGAKLYQCSLVPRKDYAEKVVKVNALLQERVKKEFPDVTFVSLSSMGNPDGSINPQFFISDGLHPNDKGYEQEAKILKPYVNE